MEKGGCGFHSEHFVPECTPEKETHTVAEWMQASWVFGTRGSKAEDCKKAKIALDSKWVPPVSGRCPE
jgi:hypothetical protein